MKTNMFYELFRQRSITMTSHRNKDTLTRQFLTLEYRLKIVNLFHIKATCAEILRANMTPTRGISKTDNTTTAINQIYRRNLVH